MAEPGYYLLSRKAHRSEEDGGCQFWNEPREFSRWEAWQDMIQMAAYREHERMVGDELLRIERGEVAASHRYLGARWRWSTSKVRRFLALLEKMDRIVTNRRGNRHTYLLVNYRGYQDPRPADDPPTTQRRPRGDPEATQIERKRKKGEGREKELTALCSEPDKPASEQQPEVLLEFPVTGNGGSGSWGLTTEKLAQYLETYPAADERSVLTELRKARQWCRDNPGRRKTPRGMPRFLSNWLAKAQDRGGIGKPASGRGSGPRTSSGGHWPYPDAKDDF